MFKKWKINNYLKRFFKQITIFKLISKVNTANFNTNNFFLFPKQKHLRNNSLDKDVYNISTIFKLCESLVQS